MSLSNDEVSPLDDKNYPTMSLSSFENRSCEFFHGPCIFFLNNLSLTLFCFSLQIQVDIHVSETGPHRRKKSENKKLNKWV